MRINSVDNFVDMIIYSVDMRTNNVDDFVDMINSVDMRINSVDMRITASI